MRFYSSCYELMSEMGRDLWEMGSEVKPKTYQNKVIENNDEFVTKELICKQYCLSSLQDEDMLFIYSNSKNWAEKEFLERISGERLNPGEAYLERSDMWNQFLVETEPGVFYFDYTYPERMNRLLMPREGKKLTILQGIIELLKEDPDTRKAVLPIFDPEDCNYYGAQRRIPCSMYYDFLIRKGKLIINYHQRSSDFVGHFGNDVYLAYKLGEYIAKEVGVEMGGLIHTIDSLHCYKKDWSKLKTSIDDMK